MLNELSFLSLNFNFYHSNLQNLTFLSKISHQITLFKIVIKSNKQYRITWVSVSSTSKVSDG